MDIPGTVIQWIGGTDMSRATQSNRTAERRKLRRHPMVDTVFVTFRPSYDVVGQLVDVSRDGIALEYTAHEPPDHSDFVAVDIFCQPRNLNLARIPCQVTYDTKVEDAPEFRGFQTRRCGLKFGRVSPEQRAQITAFLQSCDQAVESED